MKFLRARMTAKELLEINGDFKSSPLIETARRLHSLFTRAGVPYAIIGGLAVVRNKAARTTLDIDILATREGWQTMGPILAEGFEAGPDQARDRLNGIEIDVLFSGDDWGMVFPLPDPGEIFEFDEELGANFIGLFPLMELKTAVYLQKEKEEGIELAAKDLSDVVELIRNNREAITEQSISSFHPKVRKAFRRICRKALKN